MQAVLQMTVCGIMCSVWFLPVLARHEAVGKHAIWQRLQAALSVHKAITSPYALYILTAVANERCMSSRILHTGIAAADVTMAYYIHLLATVYRQCTLGQGGSTQLGSHCATHGAVSHHRITLH